MSENPLSEEVEQWNLSTEEILEQCQSLWRLIFEPSDIVEVRLFPSHRSSWFLSSALRKGNIKRWEESSGDVFFGINPRRPKGRSSKDVPICRSLMASFAEPATAALSLWTAAGLSSPSTVVETPSGAIVFGKLLSPVSPDEWKTLQNDLIHLTGCAPLKDAARIIHMPGLKWKSNQKRSVLIERNDAARIDGEKLRKLAAFSRNEENDSEGAESSTPSLI